MAFEQKFNRIITSDYSGRILTGDYSVELKKRVAGYIDNYRAFEKSGNPAIPYISAWREDEKGIWYEFVSKRLLGILKCGRLEVAETFRNSILDRRIYRYIDEEMDIRREVLSRKEIIGASEALREDVKEEGAIDAVYKISLKNRGEIWLKDIATLETHEQDKICLSLGYLTDVTKEMRAEEERLEKERLQVLLEMAGAVCHELNQPMQNIFGYSESLLINLSEDNPLFVKCKKIIELIKGMGAITKKLMKITKYETKDYIQGIKIIDIDKSSNKKK